MKQLLYKNRTWTIIIFIIVVFIGTLAIVVGRSSDTYSYESTDDEEYVLKNGLQLYMDYKSILEIMGKPDSVDEYTVDGSSLFPTHYFYVLNYDGMKISMRYVDKENIGEVGSIDITRAEQIQIFSGDYCISKNLTVGQPFKELERAYGFDSSLKTNEIPTESVIANAFCRNIEDGEFSKYDSLCCITTPQSIYEDEETKGLLFLINSDEIASIVLFNPRPLVMAPTIY